MEKKIDAKKLILIWLIPVLAILLIVGSLVVYVDPYFHYHKPHTDKFFYELDNQRSQNDGIVKYFDYDALITGTSMTENFKTSEMDRIFGTSSVKVSYQGGTYKETNDCIRKALMNNENLRIVVRGLDRAMFFDKASRMRTDLGEFPEYLYDNNPFNDLKYIYNKDVLFGRILPMVTHRATANPAAGITSFDEYSNWQYEMYYFGNESVCGEVDITGVPGEPVHITDEEKANIEENIRLNITDLADEYSDVDFYYFITPFSAAWWADCVQDGTAYKQLEAEEYIISLIVSHPNIHLYSFNTRSDIVMDLNNYKDTTHYGQWINSLMLKWMRNGDNQLTPDNYKDYIAEEYRIFLGYDYMSLLSQEDYESDFYAAALVNKELTGAEPVNVLNNLDFVLRSAKVENVPEDNNDRMLVCRGTLNRDRSDETSYADYLLNTEYIGGRIDFSDLSDYGYVTFMGRKSNADGQPLVYVYDSEGQKVREVSEYAEDLDDNWHQYVIDVTGIEGKASIVFNGGGADDSYDPESEYCFKDIVVY